LGLLNVGWDLWLISFQAEYVRTHGYRLSNARNALRYFLALGARQAFFLE
jgi:hypothetical protein